MSVCRAGLVSLCLVSAVLSPAGTVARVINADDGVRIESTTSTVDLRTGHRTYSGRVTIIHENLQLNAADVIEVRAGGKIARFEASGKPARFTQRAPFVHAVKSGRAQRMEYVAELRELKLWHYEVRDVDGNVQKGRFVIYRFK